MSHIGREVFPPSSDWLEFMVLFLHGEVKDDADWSRAGSKDPDWLYGSIRYVSGEKNSKKEE